MLPPLLMVTVGCAKLLDVICTSVVLPLLPLPLFPLLLPVVLPPQATSRADKRPNTTKANKSFFIVTMLPFDRTLSIEIPRCIPFLHIVDSGIYLSSHRSEEHTSEL